MASRLVCLAAACALASCSLSLDGPDPQRPRNKLPECDTGKGLVTLDAVAGTAAIVGGLVTLDSSREAAAIPLVAGGFFLLAALHGNNTVNACRSAMTAFAEQREPVEPARAAPARMVTKRAAPRPPPEPEPEPEVVEEQQPPPPQKPPPIVKPAAKVDPVTVPRPTSPPADASDPWRDFWKELP